MHSSVAQQTPIYEENQELSFKKINELMGVSNEVTSQILQVSEGTIRSNKVSQSTLRKSQQLIHILNMLWRLTEGSPENIRRWLREPRVEWYGISPLELMKVQKTESVTKYLESSIDGEIIGS